MPECTIYLVEDSPIMANLLRELLEAQGHRIVGVAKTAAAAIAAIPALGPEVVVVDIGLQSGSGFDVLRHCARKSPEQTFIVLTNYALEQYRKTAHELGADALFDKSRDVVAMTRFIQAIASNRGSPNG